MTSPTLNQIERACAELAHDGHTITIAAVAEHASIARSTIYRNPELRVIIEHHRRATPDGTITAITDEHPRAVIIHLGLVPAMDATGLVALDAAIGTVMRHKIAVVLAGPIPKPERMFERAGLTKKYPELRIAPTLKSAIAMAAAIEPPPASKKGG